MADQKAFIPVRGTDVAIRKMPKTDGYVYYAYDTGFIYLDKDGERYTLGGSGTGSGSSFIWADAEEDIDLFKVDEEDDENMEYSMNVTAIEGSTEDNPQYPQTGLMIINSDGRFFRVTGDDAVHGRVLLLLIAVSGAGGGSGGGSTADLALTIGNELYQGATYLYGQSKNLSMVATATKDDKVRIFITATNNDDGKVYEYPRTGESYESRSGATFNFDASLLPESSNLTLVVRIDSSNSTMGAKNKPQRRIENLKIVKIGLSKFDENAYLPLVKADDPKGELNLDYIPYGDTSIEETLHIYVDDEEIARKTIPSDYLGSKDTVAIPRQAHGVHAIKLISSVNLNNETVYTDPIEFEGAWATAGEDAPIIWVGNYDSNVVNYENSYIKYMIYDPIQESYNLPATVYLYKDNQKIMELQASYSASEWLTWDITNTYEVGDQVFSIACRNTIVDVPVHVTTEGSRDLGLAETAYLMVNMSAAGRSNAEIKATRGVWQNTIAEQDGSYKIATLSGFNWQNNGWRRDVTAANGVDNGTYLSLTNGATVSIPVDSLYLNYQEGYTIEMRLRIRNVQEYSTLVQSLPLYFYEVDTFEAVAKNAEFNIDTVYYVLREGTEADPIYDKVEITNFEEGVTYYLRTSMGRSEKGALISWINEHNKVLVYDEYGSPLMDEENVEKSYKTEEGVICKWMNDNNQGFVIGSQEAYFRSPRGIVNVRYKEDEVINLTCVISKKEENKTGLVYIYLNGILSGADALPSQGGAFRITSPFVFNSNYCDIDLYRFRVYKTDLTMPQVIHNYLSDMHNIKLYDQNQLTQTRTPTALDYNLLVAYNENHPGEQTMPYAVWTINDASRSEKLPYFKGDKLKKVDVDFVNPCLDEALESGDIDEWFYYTHCPSFHASNVEMDVQGTSSQGYPRRNYKLKYKKAAENWVYTKGSLTGQPLTGKYTVYDKSGNPHSLSKNFHMDNETVGTNKFTWKIDYMESSGSYNTGFANLMGNLQYPLYTKHPLDDLKIDATDLRTTVYGFPVLTFHKYADASNNPSNPGATYEYVGRYNMNLDKGSNEYYGFESELTQPYMEGNPAIKDIAECWEMKDNQGTWCSFKYPNAAARATRFGTTWPDNPNRLEMMRHFEYRYSPFADQLDAIGADGKYDGITSDADIIAEIGTTDAEKSQYVRAKYANFERLFDWIDSTDTSTATRGTISATAWRTSIEYTAEGENSEAVYGYNAVAAGVPFDDEEVYYIKSGNDYIVANISSFADGVTYYTHSISYYNTTFTKDTPGYRLEKFRNELGLHLDKEYCLIYFILTELLLCYDSRGKNMMMASFGPHEEGGEYIWYPIFYDIDTQLGLNNSGAYLWDYDADVTLDGLFSTPGSVLWNNFYAAFEDDIKNKYRALRGANDGSNVVNNLTYEKITGAYECNPEVFGSYAMRGIRPIIAIGLDEYYKYFATTVTGYFDTEGKTIVEDTPEYAYACQGDKKLTTELLLRNRLNYIDSWWLGGSYQINSVKQGQFWGRVNGNRGTKTSDKYLDISNEEITAQIEAGNTKYEGFEHAEYPLSYFDSRPGFKLKPFLKQYITYFTDEVPGAPVKYNASNEEKDGIWTSVNADTIETYKNDPESPNEQLVYLPGVDYLSSLGDLSTSYFSEFTLTAGKRLLDLTLGSDIPGYKNDLLKAGDGGKFTIADGPNSTTKKSLLKKIIFTGITSLQGTVDTQGSEKLEEFRSLNTGLQNVYFANGAPLHTIHLPSTIQTLQLVENADLTKILTTKPVVATLDNGVAIYSDPAAYRGLYLEGITDYTSAAAGQGHNLNSLIIQGGGLGYGSYKILENLIALKTGASTNKGLVVSLKDVKWSPYEQVEEGSPYVAGTEYYLLTDHSTFKTFTYTTVADWNYKVLNGKIYTYNENYNKDSANGLVEEQTITSLQMLDDFISMYNTAKAAGLETQFANTTTATSVPAITGEMYVANENGTPIVESDFTDVYKEYWPNLEIYAANVSESYIAKFVQINDSGKEEELKVDKLNPETYTEPVIHNDLIPVKTYYDFVGWALDAEGTKIVSTYSEGSFINNFSNYSSEMTFNENTNSVITLFAIFTPHTYQMSFDFDDGNTPTIVGTTWSTELGINEPSVIPFKPYEYSDLQETPNGDLGLYRTYKFVGWAFTNDPTTVVDLTRIKADRNRFFIAVYEDVNVYENVLDNKYFIFTSYNQGQGYTIKVNPEYSLTGKITIPATYNDKPILKVEDQGFGNTSRDDQVQKFTHIFFEKKNQAITIIGQRAFEWDMSLKYIELPETVEEIEQLAFNHCEVLGQNMSDTTLLCSKIFVSSLKRIGQNAFQRTYLSTFYIPGRKFAYIGDGAFNSNTNTTVTIGAKTTDPCLWEESELGTNILSGTSKLYIYYNSGDEETINNLINNKFGLPANAEIHRNE